jgi:probable O-glycosylation ligase (exosortase A-associated)
VRDLLIGALIFGSIPFCVWRPDIGILVYAWIGLMNPHRLSWRLADAPVGLAVAVATLLGILFRGEIRRIPMRATTALLVLWVVYTTVTTLASGSREAWIEWNRFSRILLMCFAAMMVLQTRQRLERFLWVCMASVAFFGVKGGLFSILTRGQYRVWGPPGSFIEGNNELALAELMVLPLILYFLRLARTGWQKAAYYGAFLLNVVSIIFSYSRGAFVAFAGLCVVLMARSRYRVQAFLMAVILGGVALAVSPVEWRERMFSIPDYRADESAMGRINAWHFAYNLAKDRVFGGGFRTFTKDLFQVYAPNPADVHDAHSIYFEVMAEQGFPGLAIYLGILLGTLWRLERMRHLFRKDPERRWIRDLAEMLQFSVVAYMLGGAFLGLAYFDLFYFLVISALLLDLIAGRETAALRARAREAALPPAAASAPPAAASAPAAPAVARSDGSA